MNFDSDLTAEEYEAARAYALVIEWSDEDQVYIATAPDIVGCRTHGATREEAASMGEEAVALVLASRASRGQSRPPARFTALSRVILPNPERVRRVRRQLAVSQRDFANLLNVSISSVRAWEQGLRSPDGASARLLDIAEHHPEVFLSATQ